MNNKILIKRDEIIPLVFCNTNEWKEVKKNSSGWKITNKCSQLSLIKMHENLSDVKIVGKNPNKRSRYFGISLHDL
jgi:hypothetical protein